MFIVKNKKIFLSIAIVMVLAALVAIASVGIKVGIDFKGGSLAEVAYPDGEPTLPEIRERVEALGFGGVSVQPVDQNGIYIKTRDLSESERESLMEALNFDGQYSVEERSFTSIGPSVGQELKNKSIISLILVAVMIILFIAYVFRRVSKPVSSWKYGIIAIITLLHDVILTTGVFIIFTQVFGAEADTLFIVALLTVLGLSVNDTIVVFDRVRENLQKKSNDDFETIVGNSLNQTFVRSLNTSLSTIIVLLALYFVGPETTKIFALTLAFGMFFGTYSSIFVASPLLVLFKGKKQA